MYFVHERIALLHFNDGIVLLLATAYQKAYANFKGPVAEYG
jgi:hypothetical protein